MQSELLSLPQDKEFIFQANEVACTLPMTVKTFLAKYPDAGNLALIGTADQAAAEFTCWDCFEGWSLSHYAEIVSYFLSLVDVSLEVTAEYIDAAYNDELSPIDAVKGWYDGENTFFSIEANINGFIDFNVSGECLGGIYRATIPSDPKAGDLFNVYHDTSSKSGATWDKDLITSLIASAKVINK